MPKEWRLYNKAEINLEWGGMGTSTSECDCQVSLDLWPYSLYSLSELNEETWRTSTEWPKNPQKLSSTYETVKYLFCEGWREDDTLSSQNFLIASVLRAWSALFYKDTQIKYIWYTRMFMLMPLVSVNNLQSASFCLLVLHLLWISFHLSFNLVITKLHNLLNYFLYRNCSYG